MSLVVLCLSSVTAFGADLPGKHPSIIEAPSPISSLPVASWSGFYAGVVAGTGRMSARDADLSPITNADGTPISKDLYRSGGAAGVEAGYALQSGALVYGVEADLALANLRGRQDAVGYVQTTPFAVGLEAKTNALGTLRGRVGYALDKLLVYGTGGVAFAHQRSSLTVADLSASPALSSTGYASGYAVGWTIGAGLEYAFADHFSGKVEYLYSDIGDRIRGDAFEIQALNDQNGFCVSLAPHAALKFVQR